MISPLFISHIKQASTEQINKINAPLIEKNGSVSVGFIKLCALAKTLIQEGRIDELNEEKPEYGGKSLVPYITSIRVSNATSELLTKASMTAYREMERAFNARASRSIKKES